MYNKWIGHPITKVAMTKARAKEIYDGIMANHGWDSGLETKEERFLITEVFNNMDGSARYIDAVILIMNELGA